MTRMGWCIGLWSSTLGMVFVSRYPYSWDIWILFSILLLAVVILPIVLSILIGSLLKRRRPDSWWGHRPSLKLISSTAQLCFIVAFVTSIVFSRYYWGYYFFRPDTFSELHDAKQVKSITRIMPLLSKEPGTPFNNFKMDPRQINVPNAAEDPLSSATPRWRAERQLLQDNKIRGLVPLTSESVLKRLDLFIDQNRNSFLPHQLITDTPYGGVVEFTDDMDHTHFYLSLAGGQVANDHFVYYEMLFDDMSVWDMPSKWLRFYYDVAGIEGSEWWVLTPLGFIALFFVFFPMVLVVDSFRGRASPGKFRLAEHHSDEY